MASDTAPGLSPEFARILEQYCLTPADVEREDLIVPCSSVTVLSASPRHASYRRPKVLQTNDLDRLKQWIGVPDGAVKGRCLLDREHKTDFESLQKEVKGAAVERGLAASATAGSARLDAVRAYGRAYLYGDSSGLAKAKPQLEAYYGSFSAFVFLFPKVKVSAGSVLAFGPGANVLLASEVEIEEGGQVVSLGPLTVRAGTVRKTTPHIKYAPMNLAHVLALLRA